MSPQIARNLFGIQVCFLRKSGDDGIVVSTKYFVEISAAYFVAGRNGQEQAKIEHGRRIGNCLPIEK